MVEPYDEEGIDNDDVLIRRIDPKQHVIWDHDRGCERISTKAFQASSSLQSGMSVDLEELIKADNIDPKVWVTSPRFRGSVSMTAGFVRNLGLRVGYEPVEEEGVVEANPYHGEVWGPPAKPFRFTKSEQKQIQESVEWYVQLDGVAIR